MDAAQIANLAASALACASATAAATVYHLKARWWMSWTGRHIMGVTVSIGLLGLYTLLMSLVWQTGPVAAGLRIGRTVVMAFLAVMMLQRVLLVIEAQKPPGEARHRKRR
jgi:CBS domain containing-hemolysin-like protein